MFPENLSDREKYIEEQVLLGNFSAKWSEIVTKIEGVEVKINVMEDALKIDDIRVNVSATLSQRLADLFDASLPTPVVADMMFSFAERRAYPCPMTISTSVSSMIKHSQSVDKQIGNSAGLASTVGKHWVLDKQLENNPSKACNYGWHFDGPAFQGMKGFPASSVVISRGNYRVIQPNAIAHDRLHSDYSQVCQLVSQTIWIDGVESRFSDAIKDPSISRFFSHQGPLKIDRQPGVSKIVGQLVLFPI
jgi:hypothetical protein